jgi:hypothetical protein
MRNDVAQLLLDALRALLSGTEDGREQARVKLDQAQSKLLGETEA